MCDRIVDLVGAARRFVSELDAGRLRAQDALTLVDQLSELERLIATARTFAVGRVEQTGAWCGSGASSARAWAAAKAGSTLDAAAASLRTAATVESLPLVRDAMVAGCLSEIQAAEITAPASVDPSAEATLLLVAERSSVAGLRERCRDVVASARGDEDAIERIRRGRYFRAWTAREGGVRVEGLFAPDDAAPFVTAVRARADALMAEARRSGEPVESADAYTADAVLSLVDGAGEPKTVVHVHVSAAALARGRTQAGETCHIDGVGPISVSAAERLAAKGVVKILEIDGVDVRRVAHAGRGISTHLRTAVETLYPTCAVPKCNKRRGLEIDHVLPLSEGGLTTIENLVRLCRWHHSMKTHHGWRISGGPDGWTWTRKPHLERTPGARGP